MVKKILPFLGTLPFLRMSSGLMRTRASSGNAANDVKSLKAWSARLFLSARNRMRGRRVASTPLFQSFKAALLQRPPDKTADDVVEEAIDFLRSWANFHFPRYLMAVDRIQRAVFIKAGRRPGNFSFFAAQVENWFIDPAIMALVNCRSLRLNDPYLKKPCNIYKGYSLPNFAPGPTLSACTNLRQLTPCDQGAYGCQKEYSP